MATVTVTGKIALDMWGMNVKAFLTGATFTQAMANAWNMVRNDSRGFTDNVNTLLGENLTYKGNLPSGGTFDSWVNDDYTDGFVTGTWKVEGFTADAKTIGGALADNDAKLMFSLLLKGNDSIAGGMKADVLGGFAGSDTVAGNGAGDKLYGGSGNDRLSGGAGNDRLTGESGDDKFVFDQKPGSANADRILDFSHADDTILLKSKVFDGLAAGTLASGAFFEGTAAHDSSDRLVYDSATGKLYFDADGEGGTAKVLFAILDTGLNLGANDFSII